jgi:arginyl-tRNA synthetase
MRQKIIQLVEQALQSIAKEKQLELANAPSFTVERPKIEEHGDFATNAALALAKFFTSEGKPNPRKLAEELQKKIGNAEGFLTGPPEIAGPGYLNFRLAPQAWWNALGEIFTKKENFGHTPQVSGSDPSRSGEAGGLVPPHSREVRRGKINLEFVSANPTGPMHVGHGRGAAYGDSLARIMKAAGFDVTREYYINDRGNQAALLGQSVHIRYKELLGESFTLPADVKGKAQWYQGAYVIEIAQQFKALYGDKFANREYAENIPEFRRFGIHAMLERIKEDLAAFGVSFDVYSSELALFERGDVEKTIASLQDKGRAFEDKGALWFRTPNEQSKEGDELEGRVLRKQSGDLTYFATDIGYHQDKFNRGFTHLIDIWGADHHGYIPRMKEAMSALGKKPEDLEVLLVQFVTLNSSKVGKRSGNFVTLRELIDEVGKDATRFFFLMRSAQSQLDFDMDLAKAEGLENPVYHAQYGHARCCSIISRAKEVFEKTPTFSLEIAQKLTLPEELSLIRKLHSFTEIVQGAAEQREPHRVINFITDLSQQFQSYYTFVGKTQRDPVLPQKSHREKADWQQSWDWEKTSARLLLIDAVRQVISNALQLAGVNAPEKMTREDDQEAVVSSQ